MSSLYSCEQWIPESVLQPAPQQVRPHLCPYPVKCCFGSIILKLLPSGAPQNHYWLCGINNFTTGSVLWKSKLGTPALPVFGQERLFLLAIYTSIMWWEPESLHVLLILSSATLWNMAPTLLASYTLK